MKKQIKKQLMRKLTDATMIHLGSLKKPRQQKLNRYLERRMECIAEYYVTLLTKKQQKQIAATSTALQNSAAQLQDATDNNINVQ